LPPGVSLVGSSGTISGSPTQSGSFSFSIQVNDSSAPAQTATKALSLSIAQQMLNVITNGGAVPDSKEGYLCSIASGTTALVCTDITFTGNDVGRPIYVYRANSTPHYTSLATTISSVTNSSTVVLALAATQTATNTMVQVVGPTNNYTALQNTINQACAAATPSNPVTVLFPAGVYGFLSTVNIPAGCGNMSWVSSGGKAVLLETNIISSNPANMYFGQGSTAVSFGSNSSPGRIAYSTNPMSNISISAGSNALSCTVGCNFTTADIGKPLYLEFAGADYLPLWTTVTGVSGTPNAGIYPALTLANNAQTALPIVPSGIFAGALIIGYSPIHDIDIGGVDIHDVSYYYQRNFSGFGIPLVEFGSASQVVKQRLNFHDLTLLSASNGCTGNNGPLDQFTFTNITCLGSTDAGFYLSGNNSNGTFTNDTVDNTGYPFPTENEFGILAKSNSHLTFNNLTIHCFCSIGGLAFADYANFYMDVEGGDIDMKNSPGADAITSNITKFLTVHNTNIQNVTQSAFRLVNTFTGGISGAMITGVTVTNAAQATQVDSYDTSTQPGPSNITFENNSVSVIGNGIVAFHLEGVNHWSNNILTNVPGNASPAWQITQGGSAATNYVQGNTVSGFRGTSSCDSSCVF
jgi:hypothetical protein